MLATGTGRKSPRCLPRSIPAVARVVRVSIEQRIHAHYAGLSPQEQRAADLILDHLDDLALYSSAELAQMSGVSRATLSRLYRHLGFESFTDLRETARTLRQQGVPLGPDADPELSQHLEQELKNLRKVLDPAVEDRPARAVRALADAGTVLVVGLRNSYPVALHLKQQLDSRGLGHLLYGIDVNSKFESEPGRKEVKKLKEFKITLEKMLQKNNN